MLELHQRKQEAMTPRQMELARHALGLNRNKQSFRNAFAAGPGHTDFGDWQSMVEAGNATTHESKMLPPGTIYFHLTEQGARKAASQRRVAVPRELSTEGSRSMTHPNTNSGLLPCKSCPWRVENDASVIAGYVQEKAEGLLCTVGRGDGFRQIMACHNFTDKKMIPCKGYLAQEGYGNLNVRLLAIKGEIPNPAACSNACEDEGIELEPDYETVLEKLTA